MKNTTTHEATKAGQLPTGHSYCACGRKITAYRQRPDGSWEYRHTSGTRTIAPAQR